MGGGQSRRLRSRACTPVRVLPLLVCRRARARVHAVCARARLGGLMSHVGEERDTRLENPQPWQLLERLCTSRHPLRRAGGRRSRGRARLALSRAGRPASPESGLRHRSGDEGRLGGHTATRSETLRSKVYPSLPGKTTLYLLHQTVRTCKPTGAGTLGQIQGRVRAARTLRAGGCARRCRRSCGG